MATLVKFCGLTRPADAAEAVSLGASFLGVIFAPSARQLAPARAAEVLAGGGIGAERVGLFATTDPDEIAEAVTVAQLSVVQLHGDPGPGDVERLRTRFGGRVWVVARVRDGHLPASVAGLAGLADGVVLDTWSAAKLGGTGERFAWEPVARQLEAWRRPGGPALVLAGGLSPENVAEAIRLIAPDVVDVSSGVERAPGIKSHERMRAFVESVHDADCGVAESR